MSRIELRSVSNQLNLLDQKCTRNYQLELKVVKHLRLLKRNLRNITSRKHEEELIEFVSKLDWKLP